MNIEGFLVIGCHTLVLHRTVTVDGAEVGLHAVEIYGISPHAPNTYHDVKALLADDLTDIREIAIETHDHEVARRIFATTAISECAAELVTMK